MFTKNLEALNKIQEKALQLIVDHKRIFLNWETGIGKTLPALKAASTIGGKWLWVMSQNIQKDNILEECKKFGISPDLEFIHYNSLKKKSGFTYTGIILDECHKLTESGATSLKRINTTYVVSLSASITQDRRILLKETTQYAKAWVITLKQGIDAGIIPPMQIIGVEVPMDLNKNLYYPVFKRFSKNSVSIDFDSYMKTPYLHNDFMITGCTLSQFMEVIDKEEKFWKNEFLDRREPWLRDTRWLPLGAKRKTVLAEHKAKFIQLIQQHLRGKRYVVFAETIEQIEKLEGVCIHSKKTKQENRDAIMSFNNGDADVLLTVRMLNESINLSNIDAVVILSLTGVNIQNIQRRGRSTRGSNPEIYVMYVPGTKEFKRFQTFVHDYKDCTTIKHINDYGITN
jgi:superfamily II DNA or RNA helicase